MVALAQDALHRPVLDGMVKGGSQVQGQQAGAKHGKANHAPHIAIIDGQNHQRDQAGGAERDANGVGHAVGDLLPKRIEGVLPGWFVVKEAHNQKEKEIEIESGLSKYSKGL